MKNRLIPLALLASLGLASAASAATTEGMIDQINSFQAKVTLTNGAEFDFDRDDKARLDTFKPGDTVSINWVQAGGSQSGLYISPAN